MTNESSGYSDDVLRQHIDPQTTSNTQSFESTDPAARERVKTASDPQSTAASYLFGAGQYEVFSGVIVFSYPYLHTYKVQLDSGPTVTAIATAATSLMPIGATDSSVLMAGSCVLVAWPANSSYAYIVGGIPYLSSDDKKNLAAQMQLSGNADITKISLYTELPGSFQNEGQFQNYGCGRPLDSTSLETAITTETGVSFLLDPYQISLSINEACGLFMNWFDNYTKLTGFQLDIESYAEHIQHRYDEGENVYFRGGLVYPWESVGAYSSGEDFTEERDPNTYQTTKEQPYAGLDLPKDRKDITPIYRTMEYGGYLGQGYSRLLMKPAKEDGFRKYSDEDVDYGLWQETVALDGSYSVRSAKSIFIAKYVLVPVPKRLYKVEDLEHGDDARNEEDQEPYKFSSEFGDGADHKVGDVDVPGDKNKNLLRASAVLDLLAYNYNWKGTHPFFYHLNDYKYADESELTELEKVQAELSYGSLYSRSYMDEPDKKSLKIDDRYGDVDYFQSVAYFTILEDGGVLIGDGYGSQITMTGGQIRLEAPGDVMIMPGTRAVTLCDEFFVRAKNNIELSSSEKDVRMKAEKNMQLLSGNGGTGGTLIENKSTSNAHTYKEKRGDEVADNGITLIAKESELGILGEDVYIRSSTTDTGDIVLDTKGYGNVNTYLDGFNIFHATSSGVSIWEGIGVGADEPQEATKTHQISSKGSFVGGWFAAQGDILATQGNLVCDENIYAIKNIVAGETLAHRTGMFVAKHDGNTFSNAVNTALNSLDSALDLITSYGDDVFRSIEGKYYSTQFMLGNSTFISELVGFSFNDKESNSYGYSEFIMGQPRWQQLVDVGLASGGEVWKEKPVKYQSAELYPWPGKDNWTDGEALKKYDTHKFFDTSGGYAKDRGEPEDSPYEEPELEEFQSEAPDSAYKLNGE
jgi:hypothetical protein